MPSRPPFAPLALVDLDVSASGILSLGCSRGTPTVSATLGPATALPPGTLVATRSITNISQNCRARSSTRLFTRLKKFIPRRLTAHWSSAGALSRSRERVSGKFTGIVQLSSGKFAAVEQSRARISLLCYGGPLSTVSSAKKLAASSRPDRCHGNLDGSGDWLYDGSNRRPSHTGLSQRGSVRKRPTSSSTTTRTFGAICRAWGHRA